jgi:hypothetical protein
MAAVISNERPHESRECEDIAELSARTSPDTTDSSAHESASVVLDSAPAASGNQVLGDSGPGVDHSAPRPQLPSRISCGKGLFFAASLTTGVLGGEVRGSVGWSPRCVADSFPALGEIPCPSSHPLPPRRFRFPPAGFCRPVRFPRRWRRRQLHPLLRTRQHSPESWSGSPLPNRRSTIAGSRKSLPGSANWLASTDRRGVHGHSSVPTQPSVERCSDRRLFAFRGPSCRLSVN